MPNVHSRRVLAFLLALAAVVLAGAGVWVGTRPEQDPFQASAIVDPPFPSLTYGIQTFLWWNEPQRGLHLHLVRLMSFSHAKQTFAWSDLEPRKGEWIWYQSDRIVASIEERGLQLVARLGKVPAWARAAAADPAAHDSPPADLAGLGQLLFRSRPTLSRPHFRPIRSGMNRTSVANGAMHVQMQQTTSHCLARAAAPSGKRTRVSF